MAFVSSASERSPHNVNKDGLSFSLVGSLGTAGYGAAYDTFGVCFGLSCGWERSTYLNFGSGFCSVNDSGSATNSFAGILRGVCFESSAGEKEVFSHCIKITKRRK